MTDAPRPDPIRRIDGVSEETLHAYHDGELSGLARWRLERRLRRSAALRRELAALERVGVWVRTSHGDASPDLWDAIAPRLSALDAARRDAAIPRARGLGRWAWPGAVAATATAVLALALALEWPSGAQADPDGVVRWLDSGGRNVIVLEQAPDTTIIWVFGGPGPGAATGGGREKV